MIRNREVRVYFIIAFIVSTIAAACIFFLNVLAGIISFIAFVILFVSSFWFIKREYGELEKLSGYLRRICNGEYSLDIRDNEEGELSILKNEIYKVTLMLSKQGELLKKEKMQLADAISDISHQLKTPLTSMRVMSDLLSNNDLESEKRIEFTNNIEMQLDRMQWLLTSLLKLSKIDAGTVSFKKDRVAVSELIRKSTEPLLIPIEIKNQTLVIEGGSNVSFIGDLYWTTEALINIIKNCIEHTGEDGRISIFFDENPLFTEIKILDNGSGIEKEDLPYIFKRFYKGKNAGEDSVGIGLAMAKTIVTSQNGDINVSSRKNEGTCFIIKFYKITV
ncbi:sensor histidine kinase [Clostridium beijerinckii]|jgi:Signal transduction histidine kinase|uniref:histidine kinase n=2 Tax=Clostridium beijerinckii TaxID=1520 RepID=A0AAE2RVW2_CLOBE|nr:HAMP domain-containing sensor histidine kinase [Clostridium beijerinckii]ABR34216.1 integral membrane sensor signal transduction histidine kinase [Clostridium beijerinckii NCIMB 8052]AIU01854.1 integral membrane sensor signal transduction histidine kinase [Clostridium beijerinckii ATCC 35702]MBF7811176.1 HAMP domain-containing histidine kinase [Clostridium beijerinckii]NOW91916.1 signal transduction histidine kinase [Clostridium beijerinckii]NRT24478.1 signal transduction histidine kinase [